MKELLQLCCLLLVILHTNYGISQTVSLGCLEEDDPSIVIGLDRKNWNGGSTADHSEGYLMNFTLPSNTFGDCKKITEVQFTVNVFSVDLSNLPADCSVGSYWTNIYSQCSSTAPASCPTSDLIDAFPSSDPLSISGTYTYTCPADAEFPFDDVVAFDIVPAVTTGCTNGQSMISTGQIIIDFEVCVEVTIEDDAIDTPVDLGSDLDVCSGETETIDAGAGYDSYAWNPNGQSSQMITEGVGTYIVTVTDDKGCTDTDEITIDEIPLSVAITSSDADNFICDFETVELTATTTATDIQWSNGDSGSPITVGPGSYTVTVTDLATSCSAMESITINVFTTPIVTVNPDNTSICDETPVNIQATSGFSTYDWGNGPVTNDNADLTSGSYVLTITDSNGCTATADINISNVAPPNPGTDNALSVCNNDDTYNIDDYLGPHDSGGTWTETSGSSNVDINIDPLNTSFEDVPPGVYDFSYTVTGNTPCDDESAVITVTVEYFPNAGADNFETVCNDGSTLDFDLLIGPHDSGGTWTEDNGSNSGVDLISDIQNVNFLNVLPGTYNYTYLIISGAPCPDASANLQIIVNSGAQAGMDNTVSICGGSTYDLTAALSGNADLGGTWVDTDGTGQLFGSLFNSNGFDGQTVDFTYIVGAGGSCGTDEATITLEIQDNLSAGDNSFGNSVCTIDTLDLFDFLPDADMGGDFSDLDNSGGLEDNLLITENITPGTYQYEYVIGDGITCTQESAIVEITFQETPTITLIVDGGNAFCEETCSLFTLEFTGDPMFFYTLEIFSETGITDLLNSNTGNSSVSFEVCNDGGSGTISNDTIHIGNSSTEWYILPNAFGDNNCTLDLTGVVDTTFFQVADTYISNINPTLCIGESIMVNNQLYNFDNQSGEETITNPGDCDSTYIINLSFYPAADSLISEEYCTDQDIIINGTTYNRSNPSGEETLIGLSQNGCDSIVTIDLVFFDSYDINESESICDGESILLGGAMQTMAGTYVDMFVTDNGCDSIITTVLTVLPCTVPIDIQILNNECAGGSEGSIGISLDGGDFPITVDWEGNGLSGSIMLTQLSTFGYITGLTSGSYMITILDVNGDNLSNGSIPLNLVDNNDPLAGSINIIQEISCIDEMDGSLEADISGGGGTYNYEWDLVTATTATINNLAPNEYNLIVTDQYDCSLALSQELINPSEIIYSFNYTDITCGDTDGGNMILNNLTGGTGTYIVTLDGNTISAPYEIDNLSAGAHQLIISDTNNCMMMESFNIIMEGGINFDLASTDSACSEANNGTITITNITGGNAPYSTTLNGTIVVDPSQIINLSSDTYTIIVSDINNCSIEQTVTIGELPEITFDVMSTNNPCPAANDGTISVTNIDGGTAPFVVSIDGSTVSDPSQIIDLASNTYSILVTDINNCSAERIITIDDLSSPSLLDYTLSYIITEGETITLDGGFLGSIDQIEWTGEGSLSCTDCQNPTVSPTVNSNYTITVFDANGCSDFITIEVIVNEVVVEDSKLYIPNIFSPNGDGINETFDLGSDTNTNITILRYIIYDRWGNVMMDSPIQAGSGNGWNGLYKSKEVNPGVFTYLIEYRTDNIESNIISGHITLIR